MEALEVYGDLLQLQRPDDKKAVGATHHKKTPKSKSGFWTSFSSQAGMPEMRNCFVRKGEDSAFTEAEKIELILQSRHKNKFRKRKKEFSEEQLL